MAALLGSAASARAEGFDACERRVLAAPEVYESYLCFHAEARASGDWRGADARLAALSPRLPFDGWALLVRGHLAQLRDEPLSIEHYGHAVEAFARAGPVRGELLARHNLRNLHHRRGEAKAAAAQVTAAVAAAERSGEDGLRAQALVLRGTHEVETGGDLAAALFDLRRALDLLAGGGPYPQRKLAHLALANAAFQMGRYDEAVATYERLLELVRSERDAMEEATTLFNIANARQRQYEDRPRPGALDRLEPLATAALESARRAGHRGVEVRAGALLGQVAEGRGDVATARARYEAALAIARELGHPERIMVCLWLLGGLLDGPDPVAARAAVDEAARLALDADNDRQLVYAWRARMRLDAAAPATPTAAASAARALDAMEALAARQGDEEAAVGLFGAWARDYRWLAGRLLERPAPDVEAAFEVLERMRARALLAALAAGAPGATRRGVATANDERIAEVRSELVGIQRRLLEAASTDVESLWEDLERHELELAALASGIDGEGARERARPAVATLERVRSALGPGEALLLYQVAPARDLYGEFGGGSWVVTVTGDGARVDRLDPGEALESRVAVFAGLVARRDESETDAARDLYRRLVGPAISGLSPRPTRLLVVPDGPLFELPFEALRDPDEPSGRPLGAAIEVAVLPSATTWLHARTAEFAPPVRSVLVLADPAVSTSAPGRLAEGREGGGTGAALEDLPGARREARGVARRLGPTSSVLLGAAASERALRSAEPGSFAVLHFAAHAVADARYPRRSAVHLAAAGPDEDGLLQSREIAELPIAGRLVVLSACRSAAGAPGEGEGPMSLARAFQRAGARAVVATRWPVRDDEAAAVVDRLYARLAAGERLGEALRASREDAWRAGVPAAAWTAFVLLGEPDFAPLAGFEPSAAGRRRLGLVLVALAALLLAALVRRARRSRSGTPG